MILSNFIQKPILQTVKKAEEEHANLHIHGATQRFTKNRRK
jgi:hypothetical protein